LQVCQRAHWVRYCMYPAQRGSGRCLSVPRWSRVTVASGGLPWTRRVIFRSTRNTQRTASAQGNTLCSLEHWYRIPCNLSHDHELRRFSPSFCELCAWIKRESVWSRQENGYLLAGTCCHSMYQLFNNSSIAAKLIGFHIGHHLYPQTRQRNTSKGVTSNHCSSGCRRYSRLGVTFKTYWGWKQHVLQNVGNQTSHYSLS